MTINVIVILLICLTGINDTNDNWTSLGESGWNVTRPGSAWSLTTMDTLELCMFVIVIAGVPGNGLVVAVYARKLTSSVRMYMFTLALTDVIICFSYAATTAMGASRMKDPIYLIIWALFNYSVEFSLLVLTVTAVERYWSIARPHSFTFSPRRGKVALVTTAALALATLVAIKVFTAFHLKKTAKFHMMIHLGLCTLIILVMYTLLGRKLLLRLRRRKTQLKPLTASVATTRTTDGVPPTGVTMLSISQTPSSHQLTAGPSSSSRVSPRATTNTAAANKQTQEAKAALMLFVVTAVFLACWVPVWIELVGVKLPRDVLRVYVIQSVVNPAIYGCMSKAFRDDICQFFAHCRR